MPNDRAEPSRTPGAAPAAPLPVLSRAVLALVLASLVSSCALLGGDDDEADARPAPASAGAPDVAGAVTRTLDRRASAVLAGDRARFRAGLARGPRFRAAQDTYLANLAQLPLADLRYRVDPASLVRDGDAYWAVVEVHLQLEGYDAVPVVSRDRYLFRPDPRRPTRLRLASVTDADWEAAHGVREQPWDRGPVVVRAGTGVLGIFDEGSRPAAAALLGSVERGIAAVAARVPYPWPRSVVVYALSDPRFLRSLPDLPGGDADGVDGVAFPVLASPGDPTLAATRLALHPRLLDRSGAARDRLLRHELTHVALGARDDGAPVWLSEGIAEYVSVQPMPPEERWLAGPAIDAARAGVTRLPADESFNGPGSAANYGLSWWACEYLARTFDASVLFGLLDATAARQTAPGEVLEGLLGITEGQVARRTARLIRTTYG